MPWFYQYQNSKEPIKNEKTTIFDKNELNNILETMTLFY